MKLTTGSACFNIELRQGCRIIAIVLLVLLAIATVTTPSSFTSATTLVGLVLSVVANVALLFGTKSENQWLVFVWLIQAILFFVGWPIAVMGVIFNYGNFRKVAYSDNVFVVLFVYIVDLLLYCYMTRIVYSYFQQLRSKGSNAQSPAVDSKV